MKAKVIIEQAPYGFRYRVTMGSKLLGASQVYAGFDDVMYALHARFPGAYVTKVEVLG